MMTVPTRLGLCLLGYLHWAFGNLYEIIVFSPNLLFAINQEAALERVRLLFRISAPFYYFLPWSALTLLLTLATGWRVYRDCQRRPAELAATQHWLCFGVLTAVGAGLLTWYLIVAFNLTLYVGTAAYPPEELHTLLWRNTYVGLLRLVLVAGAAVFVFKAWRASERPGAYLPST